MPLQPGADRQPGEVLERAEPQAVTISARFAFRSVERDRHLRHRLPGEWIETADGSARVLTVSLAAIAPSTRTSMRSAGSPCRRWCRRRHWLSRSNGRTLFHVVVRDVALRLELVALAGAAQLEPHACSAAVDVVVRPTADVFLGSAGKLTVPDPAHAGQARERAARAMGERRFMISNAYGPRGHDRL